MEIERKFLVKGDYTPFITKSIHIVQAYLCSDPNRTVRIRIKGDKGYITIKGISSQSGASRFEWEKEIPVSEANELLKLCEPGCIDKTRHLIPCGSHTFEVDEFHARLQGLIIAEIELDAEDEEFDRPDWLGEEVTSDKSYYNSSLIHALPSNEGNID